MEAIGLWVLAHLPEIIFAALAGYSTFRTWKSNRDKKAALREIGVKEDAIDILTAAIEYANSVQAKGLVDRLTHPSMGEPAKVGPAIEAGAVIDESIERNRLNDASVQKLLQKGDLDAIMGFLQAGKSEKSQ